MGLVLPERAGAAAETNDQLIAWLSAQTNLLTWSADVTQTRILKSLAQPLTVHGHVWFAAPNRFRWELGKPATTIAVRQSGQMWVIYPKLKRVERYALSGELAGPWKDTFALLEVGFPRSQPELEARFKVISQETTNGLHEVVLQPRSPSARRLMPEIRIGFATADLVLRVTQLQFADGSILRNEFTQPQFNPPIDPALFEPKPNSDFRIIDPLNR